MRSLLAAFAVFLAAPVSAAVAPSFSVACGQAVEGSSVPCTVTKSAKASSYSKLAFSNDLNGQSISLTFANSELKKTISIPTPQDTTVNGSRTFAAKIIAVRFARIAVGSAVGTILDDDVTPADPTLAGLPSIASNFDVASELIDVPLLADRTDQIGKLSDPQGAFRFLCNPGQVLYDDPIVHWGKPGASHLHQFYGNTAANAYSTYESLRRTGGSTCFSPLNRSAYWQPAMLDGKGNVVRPDYIAVYYKRKPTADPTVSDPTHLEYMGKAASLPNGLRFFAGYDFIRDVMPSDTFFWFNCDGPTGVPGNYTTLEAAAKVCPADGKNKIGAVMGMPDCWDGKNLDVSDHRSHMAYHGSGVVYTYADGSKSHDYNPNATITNIKAYEKCDVGHPIVLPTFTIGAWFTVAIGDDPTKWRLASDMDATKPAGYSFHSDWFGAWDNNVLSMWIDNCINKYMSCESGNLGNGKELKATGFTWTADPHLVPVPPHP